MMEYGLTERLIKKAEIKNKKYFLSDRRGLILEINPNGSKYWIVRIYGVAGKKEIRRNIGLYPEINLKEARKKAFELKEFYASSPSSLKKITFGRAYELFYDFHFSNLSLEHQKTTQQRWQKYIRPELENLQLNEITAHKVLCLCQKIIKDGHVETAKRVKIIISQVFQFAVAQNLADSNPVSNLSSIFPKSQVKHFSCIIEPKEIGMLMRGIEAYPSLLIRLALMLSARTFCRPGEIRHAEWSEINFSSKLWTIKAEKMKMGRDHLVPLSDQSIALLEELREFTGRSRWLFPSPRDNRRAMSENTVRMALRSMGYTNEQMTPHGFRSMASTLLNTFDWPRDYIELQLSHVDDSVRGIYNRALYLEPRKAMMQWWSDYLDSLRDNLPVPQKPAINIFG